MYRSNLPLLAWSSDNNFGAYSSYQAIVKHLPCHTASIFRQSSTHIEKRIFNRILRTWATSNWYQISSAQLEWQIWQGLYKRSYPLAHLLWGERDLGFLNLLSHKNFPPLCCTFHSCPDEMSKILQFKDRLKQLSAIIIMSETQRRFFEESGVESHKIHFIPHGIDTDFFVPYESKRLSEFFTVLSVGSYRRNFPLIRQVALKLRIYPNIRIKVISGRQNLKYFADLKNVEFIERITDLALKQAYQSASCLLVAVEDSTANNALLEGLACGLPIVTDGVGGIPEYLNETCSLITDAKQPELLVESIVSLSESLSKCSAMGEASRSRAIELDWSNIAARTNHLYSSLV